MRPIKFSKLLFRIAFIALFGCLGWTVVDSDASASGTWQSTGNMITARSNHHPNLLTTAEC